MRALQRLLYCTQCVCAWHIQANAFHLNSPRFFDVAAYFLHLKTSVINSFFFQLDLKWKWYFVDVIEHWIRTDFFSICYAGRVCVCVCVRVFMKLWTFKIEQAVLYEGKLLSAVFTHTKMISVDSGSSRPLQTCSQRELRSSRPVLIAFRLLVMTRALQNICLVRVIILWKRPLNYFSDHWLS